jgi:putative transposase
VADRLLWVWLSQLWNGWRSALVIVNPETVIAWHRRGFRMYWGWKSRHRQGRPAISREVIDLIRRMSMANPRWGAPRIHGELLKLGFELAESTVAKYRIRPRNPPSQTWRTFLTNHIKEVVSSDFFVVPTVFFRVWFVFVILSHDRRQPVHVAVTEYPTSEWIAHQLLEALRTNRRLTKLAVFLPRTTLEACCLSISQLCRRSSIRLTKLNETSESDFRLIPRAHRVSGRNRFGRTN